MSRPTSSVGAAEHALYRLERYMRVRVTSGAFLYSSQALRKRAVCSVASAPSVPRRLWRPAGCARHISPPPSHRVRHGRARLKPFACGGFLVCNPLAAHHPVPIFVRRCTTVALRSVGSTCLRPRVPKSGFFFLPTPICISLIRPRYLTFEPRGRFCTRRHVCDHSLLARRCATLHRAVLSPLHSSLLRFT